MKPRLVFTAAVFDMLHHGHTNLLRTMRTHADDALPVTTPEFRPSGQVLVILHDDLSTWRNKGRFPVQSFEHRKANLQLTQLVDLVWQTKEQQPAAEFANVIRMFGKKYDLLFMRGDADDWPDGHFPARQVLVDAGVEIRLIGRTPGISSTAIRDQL